MFEQTNATATTVDEVKNLVMSEKQVGEADRLLRVFAQIMRESANKIESSRDGLRAAATALKNSSERTRQLVLGGTAERVMKEVRRQIYNMVGFLHEQEEIHEGVLGKTPNPSSNNSNTTSNSDDDEEWFT